MKKHLLLILFYFILINLHYLNAQNNNVELYQFRNNNLYGLINKSGDIITEAKYTQIGNFSEGLASIVISYKKTGYINEQGKIVIEPIYQATGIRDSEFSEGLAVIKLNGKEGYINKKGEIVLEPKYYKVYPFKENFAVVELSYGNRVVINKTGKIQLRPIDIYNEYTSKRKIITKGEWLVLGKEFNEGVIGIAIHKHNSPTRVSFIDTIGNLLFDFKPLLMNHFKNGLTKAKTNDNKSSGYINKKGEIAIPFKYTLSSDFNDGYAKVKDKDTNLYGIINKQGNYVVDPIYNYISKNNYSKGLILVKNNNEFGYIDINGKVKIKIIYKYGLDFSDGLALVTKNELTNEKIYIDENGKQAFELNFYNSSYFDGRFKNGLAVVRIKGKDDDVHINKKGKVVFISK